MKTRLVLMMAIVGLVFASQPVLAQDCVFQMGFKALRDLIPDVVGDCLENERHDPETGTTLQDTTNGHLIWRKADNWTAFTDGQRTWINGPEGLQQRLNSERLPWEAPAPASVESRLTLEQLRNAEYRLPLLGDEETPIRFDDGEGSIAYGEGATERDYAGIEDDMVAFGDLDDDGIADAAVVVFTSGGGSGTSKYLIAVLDRDGAPVQAARVYLGDRVQVESVTIASGEIVMEMLAHRRSDGLCCPTLNVTRGFALRGNQEELVPRQALVIESPLPGEPVASGVEVRGNTSTHPSGDGLAYLVYDARGGVIGMGRLPVDGGEGHPGTFAAPVEFIAGAGGPGRIELVDVHQDDGSVLARTTVQVFLQGTRPTEATGRPTPELVLEAPLSGATVGATVELRGRISAMPFEKNLSYRIYNQARTIVGEGAMLLEGPFDGPGTFAESIAVTGTTAPGPLRIEVSEESPVDGSLVVSTSVEVWFVGGS